MLVFFVGLMAIQAAAAPPSEIRKTDTKTVVVSDVRYRGPDNKYPKPHNFEQSGVGYTEDGARLCNAAHDMLVDNSAPTGWQMEAIILKGAGIDIARDDEATIKRKAKAWVDKERGRNACTQTHALFSGNASWMEAMIHPNFDGYHIVDKIIVRYGLPLNDVAVRDGRTVLDFVADQMDAVTDGRQNSYKRIYGTLRRLGARHRKELELDGTLASPSQQSDRFESELAKSAQAGDLNAMWTLAKQSAQQGATSEASQWLQRSVNAAKAAGDSIIMTEIGLRLVDPENKAKAPFTGQRAEGVALLEAARKFQNPNETFGLIGDREYALGWAYLLGKGVPRNEAVGLEYLASRDAVSIRLAAGYLLDNGRRAEAIARLRAIRGPEGHYAFRDGKSIVEWLKAQPEGLCGRDNLDGDPCK